MLERAPEVRLWTIREGIQVLSVLGFPPLFTHLELPPPSNPPYPIPPAYAFSPHWPWNLTSADLSYFESGDP